MQEKAEKALYEAVLVKKKDITLLLAEQDYTAVLTHLADLQVSLDTFFAEVMVMVDDAKLKNNRLALLAILQGLLTSVADIAQLS